MNRPSSCKYPLACFNILQWPLDPQTPTRPTSHPFGSITTFLAIFQTIGPNLSYGVFQSYYTSSPHSPIPTSERTDKALVAFVGTLGSGLTWGGSIYVGPMLKRAGGGGEKRIAVVGAMGVSLGFLLASFGTKVSFKYPNLIPAQSAIATESKQTWHLLLTQGLVYGIGSSLLYFPLVGTAPTYFGPRRGTAMGIILSAAGVGGLTYSLLLPVLLDHFGARWTLRVMALENLIVSFAVGLYAQPSRNLSRSSSMVDLAIVRKPAFILQAIAALLQAAGNFVPMTFTPEFSGFVGYSVGFGAVLLAINNGVNAVSRVLTGVLADAFGRQNVLILSVVGSAISVLVLWLVAAEERAKDAWVSFIVVYGVMAGGESAALQL